MAADELASGTGPVEGSFQAIDRQALDAARVSVGIEANGQDVAWTACPAPTHVLVVDRDGSLRACDHGSCPLQAPPATAWAEAWRGGAFARLRERLAAGQLPLAHCGGCAAWSRDGLLPQAPLVRDHGAMTPGSGSAGSGLAGSGLAQPRTLVLRLPSDGDLTPTRLAEVAAMLPHLTELVVDSEVPLSDRVEEGWLALLRGAEQRPTLTFRLRHVGDAAVAGRALQGLTVAAFELTLDMPEASELLAMRALADQLGARPRARFVFRPETWFQFEEVARACAAHGLDLDLRVLDRDGVVPLAALAIEDLTFVKNVVTSAWSRCGSASRPTSLAEHAFWHVSNELRRLLRRCAEDALRTVDMPEIVLPLRMPPLGHPWFEDGDRQPWWLVNLFGQGYKAAVRGWLLDVTKGKAGEGLVRRHVWLRVLCQRLAFEQGPPELLGLLGRTYGDGKPRTPLDAADRAFAAEFDLRRFGGPWATRLGLDPAPPRKRPFGLGKPRQKKPGGKPPDLTVLIPSYRHANYIEETIRSVLAQRYTNFRLLVVDDCSPDDTVAKAKSFDDPRLQVLVNDTNLGLGNTVLRALEVIDTPYVALLNSDDLFHPDRLERCRDVLEQHPKVQLVTTGMSLIDSLGGQLTPENASLVLDGKQVFDWVHWFARATPSAKLARDHLFEELLERNFLATSSNMVARTDWIRGRADALRSLKYCLDWQIFLEAALEKSLRHLPEPLVAYRLHATNTVWFRGGQRWSFFLEVNRVLAEALRRFVARSARRDEPLVVRLLEAVARHVAANREADGIALFVNTTLDALQIDRIAVASPRVQELLQRLDQVAQNTLALRDRAAARGGAADVRAEACRRLIGELAQEQATLERDRSNRLQTSAESLEARLRDCWSGANRLQQDKQALQQKESELDRRVRELVGEVRQVTEQRLVLQQNEKSSRERLDALDRRCKDMQRDLEGVRGDLQIAREQATTIKDLRGLIAAELSATRDDRDRLRGERDGLLGDRDRLRAERDGLSGDRDRLRAERDGLSGDRDGLRAERDGLLGDRDVLREERDGLWGDRDRLRTERDGLLGDRDRLREERDGLSGDRDRLREERDGLSGDRDRLRTERDGLLGDRDRLREERDGLSGDRDRLREERDGLSGDRDRLRNEMARQRQQLESALAQEQESLRAAKTEAAALLAARDGLAAELIATKEAADRLRAERDQLDRQRQQVAASLERESAQVLARQDAINRLELQRNALIGETARTHVEVERLTRSSELRIGRVLWKGLLLSYMSRHAKNWYNRLVDAKDRYVLWSGRGRNKQKTEGVAIVASCWHWPIYSHTFVYQEMIGLTHMGLDVKMFYWAANDTSQLQPAFSYLADHQVQLKPVMANHVGDKEHFEKTKPGRLRALLERVAAATGRTVEDLEQEPHVLRGCTFARMAELAGARYLHTYFFYDQSFLAMIAGWLLGIPRGMSCYADHMLDDHPFKLVPLHIELASVIVATSSRIKKELSEKSGGRFDDKIIVKPNGVDGARFPVVDRPTRQAGDLFEVVSVSRIEPKKGLIHLVEAVADLKKRGHHVKAHVIGAHDPHSKGSLEYAQLLERTIAELGLTEDVVMHGMKMQEEIIPLLQKSRAFVAPYVELSSGDKDGIPTAMLEALASGLPVVTTNSGSISEVVDHGVEALVVPQNDTRSFADALDRLIREPALESQLSQAARARFDREFDIKVTERRFHERVAGLLAVPAP